MRAFRSDWRSHVELIIHLSPTNKQKVMTLAECALIHRNTQKVSGSHCSINGYGGQTVMVSKVPLTLQIGHSQPHEYKVLISPIPENILSFDIVQSQTLETSISEFHLQVRVIKPVLRANDN